MAITSWARFPDGNQINGGRGSTHTEPIISDKTSSCVGLLVVVAMYVGYRLSTWMGG